MLATVINECFCFAPGAAATGTDSPSADATLTAENNSEDSLLKTPVPVAAASRLQKRRAAQREPAQQAGGAADFSDITVGETTIPGSGERPTDKTMNEEQGSRTTFLVEAATPSFLESPEKKTGRAAIKARAKNKATVADFEDITVNGMSQQEPDGSASDSYMEKGHEKNGGPATPSFLASPDEPSRRKQRFPSRVATAASSDFYDISVTKDASHNKEGRRESAADTSQSEQNKEATTPSFLASPEKKAGRTAARARAIPQVRVSAFDYVTVSEVRPETPQQATSRTEDDAENSRGCAATPSFLVSPDERSRAKSRFQRRVGVATEADFDDISVRDATAQKSPQSGKDQVADTSQREQGGSKTSLLEAATPTFLASPAVRAGRAGKGARGKIRAATGVADFDDITLGDAASENRSGGAEETSQREENSVSVTLVDVATPSFLASPAEKTTRRQVRTKKTGAAVDLADFTNLDRSLTPKSRETGQDADPAIGSLTPSFLKDSTIQTSVRSAREASVRDDSSAATPRRNRNEKTGTSRAADSAEENRSERAEKVSEGPAGAEEEEGDRGSEKSQKLEETRALRASRKSEVLGYLVR